MVGQHCQTGWGPYDKDNAYSLAPASSLIMIYTVSTHHRLHPTSSPLPVSTRLHEELTVGGTHLAAK